MKKDDEDDFLFQYYQTKLSSSNILKAEIIAMVSCQIDFNPFYRNIIKLD